MSTTKLSLYNGALLLCEEEQLSDLTDAVEARRLLDSVWDRGAGAITAVLEDGLWNFAMRTVQVDYDSDVDVLFGLRRAFSKPTDWVRTAGVWQDEYLASPLLQYRDEGDYWYADIDTIYVQYVSNDTNYGSDLSRWSEKAARYFESYLAVEILGKISHAKVDKDDLKKLSKERLTLAQSKDAQDEQTKFLPEGRWVSARRGRYNHRDRGSRSQLIG